MRRTRLIPALLVLMFSACNERLIDEQIQGEMGEIQISLDAEERVEIVSAKSGDDLVLPEKEEFWIEIFNSNDTRVFRKQYSEVAGRKFGFNEGDYTLLAYHGDSLGVGFDKPYFMAKEEFEVKGAQLHPLEATAILSNVKVAVEYGDQIKTDYSGFYTEVRHAEYKKKVLTFSENEQRSGFIPGGGLTVTVYAKVDGVLKCFTLKDASGEAAVIDCEPNDFITFNVNTGINYGGMVVNVKIDNGVELVNKEFEVPADAVDETLPVILLSSFDENGDYFISEGVQEAPADLGFTYKAYSGISECVLSIESDYLSSIGIPSEVDLKNLSPTVAATLENAGFFLAEHANVGVIGFEDVIYKASKDVQYMGGGKPTPFAKMTLSLKDTQGKSVSETVNVSIKPNASATITLADYDVWATKVVNPVVSVDKGNLALMDIQYSMDGNSWTDFMKITSAEFPMGNITGLAPDTKYYLRVVYDDWYQISDVLSFTTEDDAQIANGDFENWTTETHHFTYNFIGSWDHDIDWYYPQSGWAVNSKKTMPSSTSVASANWNWVRFPMVAYSSDAYSGSKSAVIFSVSVGDGSSSVAQGRTNVVGEMWTGAADGSGNHANNDGFVFKSRPSSLVFAYKYKSVKNETYAAYAELRAEDGSVIATASTESGTSSSVWTTTSLNFNYSVYNKKTASIYLQFKSSKNSSPEIDLGSSVTIANGASHDGNFGSILHIDGLKLTY